MPLIGEYEPSTSQWVRDQVDQIEKSGGTEGTTLRGMPVIVLTTLGARSGKLRKTPLMRVEHEGRYAAIASLGGSPRNPVWYANVVAHPLPMLKAVYVNVFSCKAFDTESAKRFSVEFWRAESVVYTVVTRT